MSSNDDSLPNHAPKATLGQGFLLMGGDCAEAFDEVRESVRVVTPKSPSERSEWKQISDLSVVMNSLSTHSINGPLAA